SLDIQGRITFVNDFLLNLTGWDKDEVIGKDWFDTFIPREQRDQTRRFFFESIAKGEILPHYENDIVTSWDERRTVSFTNVLLRDSRGKILGTASIGHDITVEKQAAEDIRESRRQVLDILESITDGFFAVDNDWRFTYVNHKAEQLLGKRKEEILFKSMWDAFPEVVGTRFYKEFKRAKEEMLPLSFEEFYPPLNNWFEVHVYPYKNGLSGYFDDVTLRKHTEEALKASEKKLLDITSALGEGVFVLNGDGRLTFMNREAERLLGFTESELLGKDVHPIIHYQRSDESLILAKDCPILNVIETGKTYHSDDDVFTRKDGRLLPVSYVSTPIIENGRVVASVTAFYDITERKRAVQKKKLKHHA
ncbi:MAG: PAS domain-containing protein, partial [Candidatus Aquicultor sp.]